MKGHSKVSQYWDAKMNRTMNKNFHQSETDLDLETTVNSKAMLLVPEFWTMILCLGGFFFLTIPPLASNQ